MSHYYAIEVETTCAGVPQSFGFGTYSVAYRGTLPPAVDRKFGQFVASVLDCSDVTPSFDGDYPARLAWYRVTVDGTPVIESTARRPVRPEVLA